MAVTSRNTKMVSCLCGGVQLKIKGFLRHVLNCHCIQCMKTHGNYATYTNALEKNIRFVNRFCYKWCPNMSHTAYNQLYIIIFNKIN